MTARARLLIVYHTQSGNTGTLAHAVSRGAQRVDEADTVMLRAFDAGTDDLLACNGCVLRRWGAISRHSVITGNRFCYAKNDFIKR